VSTDAADLLSLSVAEFLDRAGARSPTPGGGSVAALVGALGTTMGQMSARYTAGNPKYAEHEPAVRAWLDELARAREAFCELIAEDVSAYSRLAEALKARAPAGEPERARALATATAVPMEIVAMAATVAGRMDGMKNRCNVHLLSDLVVGAVLCDAAAHAAAANARANLSQFADRAEAARVGDELRQMLDRVRRHRDSVEAFAANR
jgi:formiminotetrahydrofolate cyclodeaminase